MKQGKFRWQLYAACLVVVFAATACFRDSGDPAQGDQISLAVSETPLPTSSPLPSETPVPTETPTPTETLEVIQATAFVDQPIADVTTPTATLEEGTKVAQVDEFGNQVIDEFSLTSTVIVLNATQTAEFAITQTAAALFGFPTLTETPTPTTEFFGFPTFTPTTDLGGQTGFQPTGGVCIHEVKAGETLFRLSMLYGVSINQLAAASGITNIQLILVGQKVTIPGCGTTGVFPPPTSTPTTTFTTADTAFGTGGVIATTDPNNPNANLGQGGGFATNRVHVVQQYETLFEISLMYDVPIASIAAANGITNVNFVLIGTELIIPAQ